MAKSLSVAAWRVTAANFGQPPLTTKYRAAYMGCIPSSPAIRRRGLFGGIFGGLFGGGGRSKNRIYPNAVRREEELQTLVLMSASSRVPLITLWTTQWSVPATREVSPLVQDLIGGPERVGEAEGGVSFVEVEMDSPEMGGVSGLALRYGINDVPTLLAFDRQEPQIETKVGDLDRLRSREFLTDWIRTEAARHGTGGAGGTVDKFLGRG